MGILSNKETKTDINFTSDFHLPSSENLLMIFTRNPEVGKVKTRLAKTVGDNAALEIYKFLLQHTVKITENLEVDKEVHYSEQLSGEDFWDKRIYNKKLQMGKDLGRRMEYAFAEAFKSGYKKIVVIGSDMYDLSSEDIWKAFGELKDHDYVVGPAKDGGYYLLGMKSFNPEIFRNKEWGTPSVLEDTLKNLDKDKVSLLEERNDIDLFEDIKGNEAFTPFLPENLK